jgi:hypothetical protein
VVAGVLLLLTSYFNVDHLLKKDEQMVSILPMPTTENRIVDITPSIAIPSATTDAFTPTPTAAEKEEPTNFATMASPDPTIIVKETVAVKEEL